jgi:hypothetical protein
MIPEERNRGFAFGTKERFLPFQRKDRSVQAKRRKQKIQSDSRERRNARIQLLCRSRSSLSYPCFLPPAMAPPSSISFLPDELPVHAAGRAPAVESPSQNCQSASGLLPAQCQALPLSCCLALSYWLRCLASFCLIQESRWTGSWEEEDNYTVNARETKENAEEMSWKHEMQSVEKYHWYLTNMTLSGDI